MVRYRRQPPRHYVHDEWVYNEAEFDSAAVVWAREMGRPMNRRLLKRFRRRQAWLLEPDTENPHPEPYVLENS